MNCDKIEKNECSNASNELDVSSELDSSFESMFVYTIQINKIIGFDPDSKKNFSVAVANKI